jgi:hypothetical protein
MSRAEEIRAKAARFTRAAAVEQQPAAKPALIEDQDEAEVKEPAPRRRPPRTDPVRSTVDLPPAHHRKLNEWCDELAWQLGQKRITRQTVLAGLVELLLTDETTARRLQAQLAANLPDRG